jgi:CRISPR-associated endonuclease/helicase Cas3
MMPDDGELRSHPDKLLSTHVDEVREATLKILGRYSPDAERERIISDIVSLHDLGKASPAFQKYIRDPSSYRGARNEKAHTPVGFTASLLLGERQGQDSFWKLCVAAAVLGHHSGFPTANRLTDHFLLGDEWARIIDRQAAEIPAHEVSELTGFPLEEILTAPNLRGTAYDVAEELIDDLQAKVKSDLSGAVANRLKMQFVFSILLEADKAYLALSPEAREQYRSTPEADLPATLVEEHLQDSKPSEINALRTSARKQALETLHANPNRRLWTLALPTGLGKTLTAASLALSLREASPEDRKRRIFLVLPFLSIIDQTTGVYGEFIGKTPPSTLMQSHSLSERVYDTEDERDAEFFLDTWSSEIVITTFDQFLLSLLGDRSRHQMRFHNLTDAVLIFDEVQALPTQLWDIVNHSLTQLTQHLGSTVILMSATQPGFATEAADLIEAPAIYYDAFGRYQLALKHKQSTKLEDFIESILARRPGLEKERVLITLNTRASARTVREALAEDWEAPVHFLTADVTPKDRLAAIREIKEDEGPCLVISTQVVEAGVDLDMTLVIRDFAPLDSLVQIAGRCNRNNRWSRKDVEIYHLTNQQGRSFAEMVYTVGRGSPDVRLEETRRVLEGYEIVPEEDILGVCDDYFDRLRNGKDLGSKHTRDWASLADKQPNVRELLRGDNTGQVQLIVAERDEEDLTADIEAALKVSDRWDRRRALRQLAGRIAQVTVSVWVRKGWHPTDIANPLGHYDSDKPLEHPWWIVRPGNYNPETGLNTEGELFL